MRLIDADKIPYMLEHNGVEATFKSDVNKIPTIDTIVSKELFDQYKWERDIAIGQLKELGIGFGEKINGVYLTRKEYEELLECKDMYEDLCR